jgi:hypothetical protein
LNECLAETDDDSHVNTGELEKRLLLDDEKNE